ncbi:hypothetical protein ISO50_01605 [Morganella morganii subsp. morganii]|nr:hypothetical protein [Morganella morganii]MBT0445333.1 hypothetical protein [Morganella morganii subsp. morganii]QQO74567.1 hypothetical protein IDH72_17120 [Morganella morganii]
MSLQENLIKGGQSGRTAKGKRSPRAETGIDGDSRLNKALWVMTEKCMSISIIASKFE